MSTTKTPGQVACDTAYSYNLSERGWSDEQPHKKLVWEAIAKAVIDAQPCPHPRTEVETEIRFDQSDTGATIKAKCTRCGKEL